MNIGHEMIFASAGTGKTHALTTRYLRLLDLGVKPERIVALTFTRKAAAEFLAEIVRRLAAAASDPVAAGQLGRDIGRPEASPAEFLERLKGLVGALHRLNLGTLDAFFARMVRVFPFELGLAGEPRVLDERESAEARGRVLRRLLGAPGEPGPEQQALMESFHEATFGTEGKSVVGRLDEFVAANLELYRAAADPESWGGVARIWPDGFGWGGVSSAEENRAALERLRAWADTGTPGAWDREKWMAFVAESLAWSPGTPWPDAVEYVLKKVLPVRARLADGTAEFKFNRSVQRLSPAAGAALKAVVDRLVAAELGRRIRMTQGIGAVLRTFDRLYDEEVRRRGLLTFADLPRVLAPRGAGDRGETVRMAMEYRLDAQFDHWMFDEFQDTSFHQWRVLEGLVDEAVQDAGGRRSLFYVGDIKQAIYAWREGDPELFHHVSDRYRHGAGGGVVARELNDSWRSGPEVIAMVNAVGGCEPALREFLPEAAARWTERWRPHRSAQPARAGQAALLLADSEEERWEVVRRLLREIDPVRRGLSCAILVRRNEVGTRLADFLRRGEDPIPVVAESDLVIGTDNPVMSGLRALLQAAVHPGDSLAAQQVAMTPLAALLAEQGLDGATAGVAVLREVQERGFAEWIRRWAERLEPVLPAGDDFSRMRLRQAAGLAEVFDATGSRDVDAFVAFLATQAVREGEGSGAVRIMTIHKSKGLGFDVVLLPDLEGKKLAQRRDGPAAQKRADRSIDWILEYPGELVARHDPVLGRYLDGALAESCYEQLSLLYVALTRAKYANYVVIEPPGSSSSCNFPRLLSAALGEEEDTVAVGRGAFRGAWSAGRADWFERVPAKPAAGSSPAPFPRIDAPGRPGLVARRAAGGGGVRDGAQVFGPRGNDARDFGTALHALLAEVEWTTPEAVAALEASWRGRADVAPGARDAALRILRAPALADLWRSRAGAEVWREREFEVVLGDGWYSGRFDRLVLVRGPGGEPCEAIVCDFKSEAPGLVASPEYSRQLEIYRQAAAVLLGLPRDSIRGELVFPAAPWRLAIGGAEAGAGRAAPGSR